jgi:small subunit ribosomal protein S9
MSVINKLGRRKSSVARIYLKSGKGKITINKRDHKDYFTTDVLQYKIFQPFELTGTKGKYDATINVNGGGNTGQVEAIRLAISRALVEINADFKPLLKAEGLMTRDPRMVERKKPGQPKARKNSSLVKDNL